MTWQLHSRILPDCRILDVDSLTFGRARLSVRQPGKTNYLSDQWWYDTPEAAVAACDQWDGNGEPQGWMRHPVTGRRRPNGDAEKEYIMP